MRTELMAGQYLDLLEQAAGDRHGRQRAARGRGTRARSTPSSGRCSWARRWPAPARPVPAVYSAYGLPLGEAFQLRDDVLGVFGDPAETGKPAGDDLREGKRTVLLARAGSPRRRRPGSAAASGSATRSSTRRAADVRAGDRHQRSAGRVEDLIGRLTAEALAALEEAPITAEAKAALAELAVTATARSGLAGRPQKASAWARRFTSVQRCSVIAWIGVPGSVSSAVNSQRSASGSSNPQSNRTVSVPCRPRTTWSPSRKAAGTQYTPLGRWTATRFRSRISCLTLLTGIPSRSETSGTVSQSPTIASAGGSICATSRMSHTAH